MFFKKEIKPIGRAKVYTDPDCLYGMVRYETIIYNNIDDPDYLIKLTKLGFTITKSTKSVIRVILPAGWIHFKINKETEIITDYLGRRRLVDNLKIHKSIINRRFSFDITYCDNAGKVNINCVILDGGKPIVSSIIDNYMADKFIEEAGSKDNLLKIYEKECNSLLNENFPDWENELSYWDMYPPVINSNI